MLSPSCRVRTYCAPASTRLLRSTCTCARSGPKRSQRYTESESLTPRITSSRKSSGLMYLIGGRGAGSRRQARGLDFSARRERLIPKDASAATVPQRLHRRNGRVPRPKHLDGRHVSCNSQGRLPGDVSDCKNETWKPPWRTDATHP